MFGVAGGKAEKLMSELQFEFEHQGRTVRPGQVLHVHPSAWRQAGQSAKVERYYGHSVMLRTDNGAVPTVDLSLLSWEPHPEAVAMKELCAAGFSHPTSRDVAIWMAVPKA